MTRNDKHFLIGNENIFAIKKPDKSSEKKKKKNAIKFVTTKTRTFLEQLTRKKS